MITQAKTDRPRVQGSAAGAATKMAASGTLSLIGKKECVPGTTYYYVDPLADQRWAELVESHPQGSVFHSTKWLSALRSVYGYEPAAITTCAPGSRLTNGLVFCRIKSWLTGRRLVSLPFSDHCEPLIDAPHQLDAMVMEMKQEVGRDRWKYLEIRPVSYAPGDHTALSRAITYSFHSLDLRPKIEQLFQKFHKDCVQRKIRRAEREKLSYEEGASEILLQKFYRLLVMTRRRQGLPPQPLAWFRGLIRAFGEDLKIRVASKDGVAVASILTLSHKKAMVYKYGCSNASFNKLGGTALLFWKTIQDAKAGGFEELELGRSDVGNTGLVTFKDRWGASRTSISYWTYPKINSSQPGVWRTRLERRVVPMVPNVALEAVGKLLYKHIG